MIDTSLIVRILDYLIEKGEWVNGGEVERFAMNIGYKASNASRRLRELENEGTILREERQERNGRVRTVWYRYAEDRVVLL